MHSVKNADVTFSLLNPDRLTSVVDVGANPIDGSAPYRGMLNAGLCTVIGFEPQESALAKLNLKKSFLETYLPYAIGDGEDATINYCIASGMTSILEPDPLRLSAFSQFSEWGTVTKTEKIKTARLDDVREAAIIDLLKIDIQGAELIAFKNAKNKLSKAVAVQTEVSFAPIYKEQPSLGDVDVFLRTLGFIAHAVVSTNRRVIQPMVVSNNAAAAHQIIDADMLYVRDFTKPDEMSAEQLKHLALISHHCYASYDLTLNCISHLQNRNEIVEASATQYVKLLQSSAKSARTA